VAWINAFTFSSHALQLKWSCAPHLERFAPQFIILQCGADSVEGDPITHLRFSSKTHGFAARELMELAERLGHGRLLALGGGGYNRVNIAQAWTAVVENLL
jgi:acetoin utilization protein AcuC